MNNNSFLNYYEDYTQTYNTVLKMLNENMINPYWKGYNSFTYTPVGHFDYFYQNLQKFNEIKSKSLNKSCLMQYNFYNQYYFNSGLPIQIVNNVFVPDILKLCQSYYKTTIYNNDYLFEDPLAKRYYIPDEPLSRFLHFELLPLIEKIVNRRIKPINTYLSSYVKGAELLPHIDRPDIPYTVSYLIDKPKNCTWNINFHKKLIAEKYKTDGKRTKEKPPINECEILDFNIGSIMLFNGTNNIHFREKLNHDYYTVMLFHYSPI
jgi:hypothetical protein